MRRIDGAASEVLGSRGISPAIGFTLRRGRIPVNDAYRLIVALDVPSAADADSAVDRLGGLGVAFKVGS
jgi:hypothetical protein